MDFESSSSRRTFLSGAAGALAATSGCVGEVRNLAGREGPEQLSLSVATLPASDDPYAVRIADQLASNLESVGIAASVDAMRPDVLFRETLINQDFDLYVARYPGQGDPDELYSMLYSTFAEEIGWQNPFGFSDLTLDELLIEQRTIPEEHRGEDERDHDVRIDTIHEIQRHLIREQPFTTVCFPDYIGAVRNDRFDGWPSGGPKRPVDYLQLERVDSSSTLQLLLRNPRITRNRNPLAVEYRDRGNLTGLLYDPLIQIRRGSDEPIPWLAETITWADGWPLTATIQLRETPWHDGEPVTASDVAFTYEFLKDTSLGEFDTPAPTPWRRGRVTLVESTDVISDRRLRIRFETGNRSVARRAFSVPILPEHIWRDRSEPADIAGIEIAGQTTEALIDSNEEPVGSGTVQFVDAETDESLSLESFPEHFLYSGHTEGIPDRFVDELPFDHMEFTVAPSHDAAVQLLLEDDADAVADGLQASVVPRLIREQDISLTVRRIEAFYHVGYNCRRSPMVDPNFRRAIARMIDRETIVSESLSGYGTPAEAPLRGRWVPDDLRWDGEATLPFLGTDGTLDEEAAREAFREAGYHYDGDDLVRRGEGS